MTAERNQERVEQRPVSRTVIMSTRKWCAWMPDDDQQSAQECIQNKDKPK
ncbi:hypothetical protein [Paracoccus saliphilus]|uniref:Uncharacterized protein n=1 Tax=Paracoccus saliphilus TaxID=405559 RepID=A0AA45W4L9_9RHOB|nr:hypothetical protein [Paracoccus saliphilus]WCR04556.1 hypothetical protein JHX88_07515 [Paracoccus saliphilus]SIS86761.1 hypothetical protein SAMN05421772_10713 [Paracoccus saliphilus]